MIDTVLAILTAIFYGIGVIVLRKGLVKSNFISASFIITMIGNVIFWSLTILFVPLNMINPSGIILFILSGILAPGLARLFYILGMERLGASMNSSIFAMHPVFGSLAAIMLLHEQPTEGTLVGTSFVVCGAALVGRSIYSNNVKSGRSWTAGLAFSVFASIALGFSYTIRKMGLNTYDEPIIGVALGYAVALSIYTLIVSVSRKMRNTVSLNRQAFRLFWKAGALIALGWITSFYAVMHGDVTVVTPITDTEPLFVFLFAYLYLKELETITPKLIVGTIIIIIGVMFISIF